jgi:hypothetical protein
MKFISSINLFLGDGNNGSRGYNNNNNDRSGRSDNNDNNGGGFRSRGGFNRGGTYFLSL